MLEIFFWIWTTCPMKLSHPYLTLLCLHFLKFVIAPAHHRAHILNFSMQSFTLYYVQIASELSQVLTSSSSHGIMNLLCSKNYHPSTFDTICHLLTGYSIFFQVSHNPLSGNDIGLHPHSMDINNPQFMVLDTRKM